MSEVKGGRRGGAPAVATEAAPAVAVKEHEPSQAALEAVERRLGEVVGTDDSLTIKGLRAMMQAEFGLDFSEEKRKTWFKETVLRLSQAADEKPDKEEEDVVDADGVGAGEPKHPLLSEAMVRVVRVRRANFFRLTKLIWAYVKEHDLQNPTNRKQILCDDNLEAVFGRKKIDGFSMSKHFQRHIHNEESEHDDEDDGDDDEEEEEEEEEEKTTTKKKPKAAKKRKGDEDEAAPTKKKKTKAAPQRNRSKAPAPYRGTPELAAFVGEETNNRFKITGLLWKHIKANSLQNPEKKSRIICDDALRNLFGVDEMGHFELSKHLAKHFDDAP